MPIRQPTHLEPTRTRAHHVRHTATIGLVLAVVTLGSRPGAAQASATLETTVASGKNYDRADFRLWYPPNSGVLRAVIVLVPGSNDDGRSMVDDTVWQRFAIRHQVALVGCRFTDKPHAQSFIEEYADASRGSGQALLTALTSFGTQARHPELATAPLLLWGISAGGQFNYEFTAWKPDRVAAFVVNKGGIYYTALTPPAARKVPALLFVGTKDLAFRTNTIVGLFAVNRRAGALWALAEEPNVGHEVGRSRDLAVIFFDEILSLRLNGSPQTSMNSGTLKEIAEATGLLGDLQAKTFRQVGTTGVPNHPTAWLPSLRVARAWQALVTEAPFEP